MKRLITIFMIAGFCLQPLLQAQEVDDYIRNIDLKLRKDKKYLNLSFIDLTGTEKLLQDLNPVPRVDGKDPFVFKANDNYTYRLVFLNNAIGVDTTVLLYINEIIAAGAGDSANIFGANVAGGPTEAMVITFRDMHTLKSTDFGKYNTLVQYIDRLQIVDPEYKYGSLLGITPDEGINTSLGITSRDNTDFLNFMQANSLHWYPKVVQKSSVKKTGRGAAGATTPAAGPDFRIDAGFSSVSFSHKVMDFSFGLAGIELNMEEPVLNALPYANNTFGFGFRTKLDLVKDTKNPNGGMVLDARFIGRIRAKTDEILANMPFALNANSNFHVGTSIGLDLHVSRPFGLPFFNAYVAIGGRGFSNPYFTFKDKKVPDQKYAYFSFKQAEGSVSFYWNTSDKLTSRFRIDVGVGYYDMLKAYYPGTRTTAAKTEVVESTFSPVVTLYYTFAPEQSDVFGAKLRVFDSVLKGDLWLKLLELDGGHTFRLAATVISDPIGRKIREWENDGSVFFQLRYRYGF
ncbi:MAG: hypothetical protein LC102_00655 [Ignavibacteriales bacterium]|nr:MAG: hypothetical protein F9K26_03625 [Ignavibacteriaceae bacterium]MBW7872524.1 hypothetical protein [Ignavibacteria bacterium]MBZ0196529.1 hypothetical protein [Ignavibacteriaceae bacterium]MCZ2141923.1 hypothetical protein [Ignavibacteriales bacterium]WKZ73808.1 MAG: hypothetical protein QY308_06255 [Ignavibacteriaceae bacterium]